MIFSSPRAHARIGLGAAILLGAVSVAIVAAGSLEASRATRHAPVPPTAAVAARPDQGGPNSGTFSIVSREPVSTDSVALRP